MAIGSLYAGLYLEAPNNCIVDSYIGSGNGYGCSDGAFYPDVWVAGRANKIGQITSTGSGGTALLLRTNAINYQIGDVHIENAGSVALPLWVETALLLLAGMGQWAS